MEVCVTEILSNTKYFVVQKKVGKCQLLTLEEVSVFFPKRFHRHADTYFVWSFKTWFSPRFCLLLKYLCDKSRICTRTSLQSPKSRTSTFSILIRLDFYQYLLISVVLLANSAFKTLKILI